MASCVLCGIVLSGSASDFVISCIKGRLFFFFLGLKSLSFFVLYCSCFVCFCAFFGFSFILLLHSC
jgi:hypothetical protein